MTTIPSNLQHIHERMQQACDNAGRDPSSVTLLAVSKTFDAEAVVEAARAGQTAFGENYVQEGVDKILELPRLLPGRAVQWHCIGPVQANKTRQVAEHFDWVQSIDRLKIAQRLSAQRPEALPPLQVCIQVNVDGGVSKSGVTPDEALTLARQVAGLPRLVLRGIMAIPEPAPDFEAQKAVFAAVKAIFDQLREMDSRVDTLSMGMSEDLEAAIAAGATMIRVGRAIFGQRPMKT